MQNDEKKEHIKGKYAIVQALVTAIAMVVSALIGLQAGTSQASRNIISENSTEITSDSADRIANLEISTLNANNVDLQSLYESVLSDNENLRKQLETANSSNLTGNMNDREEQLLMSNNIPNDAVFFANHAYKAYPAAMTWANAKLYCESLDGHLVSINDIQESIFLSNYISNLESPKDYYWIGLYANSQRQWFWTTGEPYGYKNWANGEPNNTDGAEDRVLLYSKAPNGIYIGEWNDISSRGNENCGLICEWDLTE